MGNTIRTCLTDLYKLRKFLNNYERMSFCRYIDIKSKQCDNDPSRFISEAKIEFINGKNKTFQSTNITCLLSDINNHIDYAVKPETIKKKLTI